MPYSYRIDDDLQVVVTRAWGDLTDHDMREHIQRLRADPAFRPDYGHIVDLQDVTQVSASVATIQSNAILSIFDPGSRRAIIAAGDTAFGMARMFAFFAETVGQKVDVFRSSDKALEWMDLVSHGDVLRPREP